MADYQIPKAFIWRRLHSLVGLFLVFFIIEHLLTNSQAALLIGNDGSGFIRAVNFIHSLPYLPAIEVGALAIPIVIHAIWGIKYLLTAAPNSGKTDGSIPSMSEYTRNKRYTWQRITSWFLLVAIVVHVVEMRFIHYPVKGHLDGDHYYIVRVSMDSGLYTVADRLGVELYDSERIAEERLALPSKDSSVRAGVPGEISFENIFAPVAEESYSQKTEKELQRKAHQYEKRRWVRALEKLSLEEGQVNAVAPTIGTAILLTMRDTFKYPMNLIAYTVFVLAAVYHAFNGLWTFLITWGITLSKRSQLLAQRLTGALMGVLIFLGWAAIWGTYWINLRY